MFDARPDHDINDADPIDQRGEASCQELEFEMRAVARAFHSSRVRLACPVCDDPMELHDVEALNEFGSLDVKLHQLECRTCGMLASRVYHPSIGYHSQRTR